MLKTALLSAPLPQPLAAHFKRIESVGELLETIPPAYVRQCIEQTALSPFERYAMLTLLETTEIEQ